MIHIYVWWVVGSNSDVHKSRGTFRFAERSPYTSRGESVYGGQQFSETEISYTNLYFGWTQFDFLSRRWLFRTHQETAQSL